MQSIFDFVKNNKILLIIIGGVLVVYFASYNQSFQVSQNTDMMRALGGGMPAKMTGFAPPIYNEASPQMGVMQRMVVTQSGLSLVVKNVQTAISQIQAATVEKGGYMVSSNVYSPVEQTTGDITLRIPLGDLQDMLAFLRNLAVKVVSENISGTDVTDEFVDIEERLAVLERTKARYEEIMKSATGVDEIIKVQQAIFGVQEQIDSLKGRADYLDKTAKSSLITVYLATDELALPYAPGEPWRPEVVFKLAVRSLVEMLRSVGTGTIWVGVYSVVVVPLIAGVIILKKILKK